jgi:cytochrome P450
MTDPRQAPEELWAPIDDPAFYAADPFPHYARLRREAPVVWNRNREYWIVSRHADVVAVSRDPATFCSGRGILTMEIGVTYPFPPTMMHTDPPVHTRYRKLVQPGFAPSLVRALEVAVRERARELVAKVEPGVPVDFTTAVAIPYPLMIISELLGITDVDYERFYLWSEAAIPGASDLPYDEILRLQEDQKQYMLALTLSKRGKPGTDVTSIMANGVVDGDRLSDDEILMFQNQLLVAGNETTRNMISGGMWALAERPDEWARLRADRALVATCVEEWLRWTTPVISFMRTATRDAEVGGVAIREGEPVLMLYASANRDEAVFGASADRLDVGRDPNPHVAFGFGHHFCLGAALARLEGRALLDALLDRFTTLEPAGEVVRTGSPVIAGVRHTPLVLR